MRRGNWLGLLLGFVALTSAAVPVAALAARGPGPQTIVTGSGLEARLSANGKWALVSAADGEGPDRLYLWHVGELRARLIGTGGAALAVTNNGLRIAYRCRRLLGNVLCLRRVGQSKVRRVPIPCGPETLVNDLYVSGDLRTALVGCQLPHAIRLLSIGARGVHTRTVFQTLGMTGPGALALSGDGSTAVFEQERVTEPGPVGGSRTVYVYRDGVVKPLAGVGGVLGVSSDGRYLIGTGADSVQVACSPRSPAFEQAVPIEIDTRTGKEVEMPSLACAAEGSWAVSDDGRTAVVPFWRYTSMPQGERRLELLELTSGASRELPGPTSAPNGLVAPQLAGGTFLYGQDPTPFRGAGTVLVETLGPDLG